MIYFNEDIKQWIDDGEDEEETLIEDMLLDYQIFKLSMVWNSEDYIWNRWIRS